MDAVVQKVVGGIQSGEVTQAADLVINLDAAGRRALLDSIVKPYNFLKHADKDPLETMDNGDIDPDHVIGHALSALTMVSPGKHLPGTNQALSGAAQFIGLCIFEEGALDRRPREMKIPDSLLASSLCHQCHFTHAVK